MEVDVVVEGWSMFLLKVVEIFFGMNVIEHP